MVYFKPGEGMEKAKRPLLWRNDVWHVLGGWVGMKMDISFYDTISGECLSNSNVSGLALYTICITKFTSPKQLKGIVYPVNISMLDPSTQINDIPYNHRTAWSLGWD